MITAKFGGTAITGKNLKYVGRLAHDKQCVVVSATGSEAVDSQKVTDLLDEYYCTRSVMVWHRICAKYKRLVEDNLIMNVDDLLADEMTKIETNDHAFCLSAGERLAAKIVAEYLHASYLDAAELVVFDNGVLNRQATNARIKQAIFGKNQVVLGGFYGAERTDSGKICLLGRGGGDVTGALVAAASGSELYENFTDTCGVRTGDPSCVPKTNALPCLSYTQMSRLAVAGVRVLHCDAVLPVQECGIPVAIKCWHKPQGGCTIVSSRPFCGGFWGVAERVADGMHLCTAFGSDAVRIAQTSKFRRILGAQTELVIGSDSVVVRSSKSLVGIIHAMLCK